MLLREWYDIWCPFPTCTNPVIPLFNHPEFCILMGCNFSWEISQEKSKTMHMQLFGGKRGVLWDCARREFICYVLNKSDINLNEILISTPPFLPSFISLMQLLKLKWWNIDFCRILSHIQLLTYWDIFETSKRSKEVKRKQCQNVPFNRTAHCMA